VRDGEKRAGGGVPRLAPWTPDAGAPHRVVPTTLPGAGRVTLVGEQSEDAPPPDERFAVVGEVGRGAVGVVEAWDDAVLGRRVAVKRLGAHARSGATLARFHREAALTAQLEHPGIPPVYDVGADPDGTPWYSMRLVVGRTLGEALAGRSGLADRLALVRQVEAVAQAVGFAHERGVVHRDLKPDNIIIGRFGEVVVLDWGLARVDDEGAVPREAVDAWVNPACTIAGSVMGTLGYISPEAARGEATDARSDVWSLGAVLYTVLTGEPPTAPLQDTDKALELAGRGVIHPLTERVPRVPRALAAIVARALALRREDRYPDAGAMARDLTAFIEGRWVSAHTYSPLESLRLLLRRHRGAALIALAAVVVLFAVGTYASWSTARERGRAELAEQQAGADLERAQVARAAALTERARFLLERRELAEASVAAAEALTLGEDPDRRGLLMATEAWRGVTLAAEWTVPAECRAVAARGDGSLACVEDGALSLWVEGEDAPRWRTAGDIRDVRDGGAAGVLALDGYMWRVVDPVTGALAERLPSRITGIAPIFPTGGPTERAFYAVGPTLHAHPSPAGDPGVELCDETSNARGLSVAPGGHAVVWLCDPHGPIWWRELPEDAHAARELLPARAAALPPYGFLAWDPGGERVAVSRADGVVVILDPWSPDRRRELATPDRAPWRLAWSADAGHLLLERDRGGLVILDAGTGGLRGRLPAAAGRLLGTAATHLHAGRVREGATTVSTWRLGGAQPRALSHADGVAGFCVAPDGRRLAAGVGDGSLWRWELDEAGARGAEHRWQRGVVKGCAFAPSGDQLAGWGVMESSARLFDAATGDEIDRVDTPIAVRRGAYLADDTLVAFLYSNEWLTVRRGAGRAGRATRYDHGALVVDASATPSGDRIALVDDRGRVALLVAGEAEPRVLFEVPTAGPLALSEDGAWLAIAQRRGVTVHAIDGPDPARLVETPDEPLSVALARGALWLAVGYRDGALRIYDPRTEEPRAVIHAHEARVANLRFTPGGAWLWSAGWDGHILGWSVRELEQGPEAWRQQLRATWGEL